MLGKRRIERHACGLQDDERQIRGVKSVDCRCRIGRLEVQRVDSVVGGEEARIGSVDAAADCRIVETGRDDFLGKTRLVVPKANDQKRLVRKIALEPGDERLVVVRAHILPAQILVNALAIHVMVPRVAPIRGEFVAVAERPGKMIGHQIGEDEHRPLRVIALQQVGGESVIEFVWFDLAGLEIPGVVEVIDAERLLETARAEKRTEPGIDAVSAVTAVMKRVRQAARDASGGDPRHELGEMTVGTHRQSAEHIIFGVPGRSAGAFDQEGALLAVERTEMALIAGRDLDARHRADIEARTHRAQARCAAAGGPARRT